MKKKDKKWLLYGMLMIALCLCAVIYINSKSSIEDDWIYYNKGGMPYKIRTDGTGKVPD